jgi:hypothetical protein
LTATALALLIYLTQRFTLLLYAGYLSNYLPNFTSRAGQLDHRNRVAGLHRIKGYIANNTLLRTIRPADQDWINEVWFPDFAKLGVLRLAIIESQDGLNRMGIENIMKRATEHTPFDTHYFAEATEARSWAAITTDSEALLS